MLFQSSDAIFYLACAAGWALVVLLWFAYFRKGHKVGLSVYDLALLCIVLLLLLAAYFGPYSEEIKKTSDALLLIDISDSMEETRGQALLEKAKTLAADKLALEYFPFAKTAAGYGSTLDSGSTFSTIKRAWNKLDIGATSLEAALNAALTRAPASVLLISDGFENSGNAARAIQRFQEGGFKLFPLAPQGEAARMQTVGLSKLYAPLVAPAQKSVEIRAAIKNSSPEMQRGKLRIQHDKKIILEREIEMAAGGEALVVAESDPSQEGLKEISATFEPEKTNLAPSSQTIFLSGERGEKLLLINGAAEDERLLKDLLQGMSFELQSLVCDAKLAKAPDLANFSTLVLNNTAVQQLPEGFLLSVAQFVQNGGGLVMVGGNRSFGLGGYIGTALEKALPLEMVPPQAKERRLNLAVELVMDKSGSMADDNKIEYAKEAAREVIRNLRDEDYIGVVGFDSAPWIVVKIGKLSEIRDAALERVGRLFAAQRTNMLPAIEEAKRSLVRAPGGRKHMLIMTDGKIPDEGPVYLEMVREIRLLGITVSTIMLGAESDLDMLKNMAELGGGSFYQTTSPANLPRIFLKDVKVKMGEETLKEDQEYVVRQGTSDLTSTSLQSFPPLRGYVQTKPKQGANLELVLMAQGKAEPLLASWEYKQGRVLAFTSDANGRWSNYWARWAGFQRFWRDIIDAARPKDNSLARHIPFDLRYGVQRGSLLLDLSLFSEEAAHDVQAQVVLPDGSKRQVNLSQAARGRFATELEGINAGKYEIYLSAAGRKLTPVAFMLPGELFGEKRGQGFDLPFLSALAAQSGGKLNPAPEDLQTQSYEQRTRRELSPYFFALALLLLLFEITRRELWRGRGLFGRRQAKASAAGLKV